MKKEAESTAKINIQNLARSQKLLLEVMMERKQANAKIINHESQIAE